MKRVVLLAFGLAIGCIAGLALAWFGVVAAPQEVQAMAGNGVHLASPVAPVSAAPALAPGDMGTPPDAVVTGDGQHSRFAVLARRVAPGVVNVHTSKTVVQSIPQLGTP